MLPDVSKMFAEEFAQVVVVCACICGSNSMINQ